MAHLQILLENKKAEALTISTSAWLYFDCGFESYLYGSKPLEYRKKWARRFSHLRALEALKTLGF